MHLTTAANALANRLAPWPVPFRSALSALAPQPGAPVGAVGSEVVSVVADRIRAEFYHRVGLGGLLSVGSSV